MTARTDIQEAIYRMTVAELHQALDAIERRAAELNEATAKGVVTP